MLVECQQKLYSSRYFSCDSIHRQFQNAVDCTARITWDSISSLMREVYHMQTRHWSWIPCSFKHAYFSRSFIFVNRLS